MNARARFPKDAGRPHAKSRARRGDQEFLPAALEILEKPASPVGIWFIWIICGMAVVALAFAYFGRIDIVAVAQGKIQPAGRVKVIQPLETGRIAAIEVENGQHVVKGQRLVTLDSGEVDAEVAQITIGLSSAKAEAARRRAAQTALIDRAIEPIPFIVWPDGAAAGGVDITPAVRRREESVLSDDLRKLESTIAGLDAQIAQKARERERLTATAAALSKLVATLEVRVGMRAKLNENGSGSKADLIDATQILQEKEAELVAARGQEIESSATIEVLTREVENAYRTFLADNSQRLADAERRTEENEQLLAKAKVRQSRSIVTSPIEGSVSALSITTPGQVVGAGEETMRIVPLGHGGRRMDQAAVQTDLEIEAYLPNKDIGFVHRGQDAVVKVESLPFTRFGTIDATLLKIAMDAIPEPDAMGRESNPAYAAGERGFAGAQRMQNLVFPLTLKPKVGSVLADGNEVELVPGMAVTVEISTGRRRIIDYLFSPLIEIWGGSLRER